MHMQIYIETHARVLMTPFCLSSMVLHTYMHAHANIHPDTCTRADDTILSLVNGFALSAVIEQRLFITVSFGDIFQVLLCTEDIMVSVTRFVCNW